MKRQEQSKNKLIFVGFSFWHHGKHSGYDYIRNVVSYDMIFECQKAINYFHSIPERKNVFAKLYLILFKDRPWWVELRVIFHLLFYKDLTFHFIYPENMFNYSGFFKGKRNRIICTFHQPPSSYELKLNYFRSSKYIDSIIVLSQDMLAPIRNLFPSSRVLYLPHGVDTTYFRPLNNSNRDKSVLLVGNWLRNFSFANETIQRLLQFNSEVVINVVTNKSNFHYFIKDDRMNLFSGIDDDHLLHLYQTSGVLFLPLIGFTANNALLEGAACGCKIIIATDQDNRSCYIEEKYIDIIPFDANLGAKRILARLYEQNNEREKSMVEFVRANYNWELIGARIEAELRETVRD